MEGKTITQKTRAIIAGAAAGLTGGFFGAGGGALLLPLFTRFVKIDGGKAYACTVAVTLPLSLVCAAVYYFKSGFELHAALPYLLGGAVGGTLGGAVFKKIPTAVLRRVFAALMIFGGVRSLL